VEAFPVETPSSYHHEAPRAAPPAAEFESHHEVQIASVEREEVAIRLEPQAVESVAPPHQAPPLPRIALELPPESGLVLVETTHAAPTSAGAEEPQRPRRVRPPRATIADEPLQMVETGPKDSTPPAAE